MLFMPPQHGKSELSTRRLPAFLVGLNPDVRVAICSYSATISSAFNRDIQRIIDDDPYRQVFPHTTINEDSAVNPSQNTYLRNSEIFEIVGHRGFVKTVGVGGSLTGTPVDIGIIDDPFKDREEAMSVRIRDKVHSWYTDVFKTRLHNDSQQLLIMTRWHEDDLAGRILRDENDWEVVTFQAVKERENPNDPRQVGEVLWPEKHSLERINKIKEVSPFTFNSLYQQEPRASRESLVFPDWVEIDEMPGYMRIVGIDFGFTNDPTAVIEVQKHNRDIFLREWVYKTGMLNSDIHKAFLALGLKQHRAFADSADPKSIQELRNMGLNVNPTVKGPDSIVSGINWLKDHVIHVHKDSHNLKNELLNYQYTMLGGFATNEPIDSHNHLLDAARYTKPGFQASKQSQPMFIRQETKRGPNFDF